MPRYIDADTLTRKICGMKCGCERNECGYDNLGCHTVALIEEAPTISPDEVRGGGEWVRLDVHKGMEQYKCSVCETPTYVPECMNDPMYGYCPNCGAKMEVSEDA